MNIFSVQQSEATRCGRSGGASNGRPSGTTGNGQAYQAAIWTDILREIQQELYRRGNHWVARQDAPVSIKDPVSIALFEMSAVFHEILSRHPHDQPAGATIPANEDCPSTATRQATGVGAAP